MTERRRAAAGRALLAFVAVLLAAAAAARPIHYGAVSDPAVLACDRLHWTGRGDEARGCYRALVSGSGAPAARAEGYWALNERQAANRAFREAIQAAPDAAGIRVRWGDLYAASHQHADAIELYREAIERDANNAYARLGIARVLAASFDPAADDVLTLLVDDQSIGGGARAAALLLLARTALENGRRDLAGSALDEAEAIVVRDDWPPLDVFALRAAADLVAGKATSPWTERARAYNPGWGDIHAVPAHFYVITRRYREAIALYERAIAIEPRLAAAHEALGINLLRDNRVSRARHHLEIAYREDPFSPRAVNTLRLLDSFEHFRLVEDLPGPAGGVPIVLRLHEDEAAAIGPYAIDLARRSIAEFAKRYGFEPREPIVIEMYPDHEDFAVRTAGMPGIGILGATFGYVIAMDSPSARPVDEYQWGTTLWHEMAHVFTLEATDHLVPRWFSEGVSVHEEWRSGPNPGVRLPLRIYHAIRDGDFLPVATLDEGFIRPKYDGQVFVSYMQAGLACAFIEAAWGTAALRDLLAVFRAGQTTAGAIETVLGVTAETFDERFAAHLDETLGPTLERLSEWQDLRAAALAGQAAGDWAAVRDSAQTMIEILPQHIGPDSPYLPLAAAAEAEGDTAAAVAARAAFFAAGGYDPDALAALAADYEAAGRHADAIRVLTAINFVDPLDRTLHAQLGERLLAAGRAEEALAEFEIVIALEPHDAAQAWFDVARAQHALGDRQAAEDSVLKALDIAPGFRPAQRLLLELAGS